MSPFISRLLAVCALVAGLAVAAPSVVPALLAGLVGPADESPAVSRAPASPPAVSQAEAEPRPQPVARSFTVKADPRGHYVVDARIDGRPVHALIDTGATMVALTAETARRLGLSPPASDFRVPIATANGTIATAPVRLSDVVVGDVRVRDVDALVVPAGALDVDLLGMTFLGRLSRYEAAGSSLLLVQ